MNKPSSYAEAGVDRNKEEQVVKSLLSLIATTYPDNKLPEGQFAGSVPFGNYYLSLANDGVGSKLILAQEMNKLDTIGIDAVAMCVNDLIAMGSIPVAFVDYIAIKYPDERLILEIVKGLVEGCKEAEIPLVGGETAILPEILVEISSKNGFDVAGTALGIQERDMIITGKDIKIGDKIIAVRSSGIHSNGLTLARKLIDTDGYKLELLKPTRIYIRMVKTLLNDIQPTGMANITGGGITNLLRLGEFEYHLNKLDLIEPHQIFSILQASGNINNSEMYRTFNMGIGFVIIVRGNDEDKALQLLNEFYPSFTIGEIREGSRIVANIKDEHIIYS